MEEDENKYVFSLIEKMILSVKKENILIPDPEFIPNFELFINYMQKAYVMHKNGVKINS
jgi:hypothetical protein